MEERRLLHLDVESDGRWCGEMQGSVKRRHVSPSKRQRPPIDTFMLRALPVVYHEAYSAPQLPPGHRFPMNVFKRIYEVLLESRTVKKDQIHVPEKLPTRDEMLLVTVHEEAYLSAFCRGQLDDARMRRIGFGDVTKHPLLIERTKSEVAGTLLTAELALKCGLACNTAGGTHHAFPSFGSGYCIINDMAVASKILLNSGRVSKILIFDLDVHQGDGTALIFSDDPSIFTVSIHCQSNFPSRKQNSSVDIGLPDRIADDAYLKVVASVLPETLRTFRPDLVLYDAGVDPHERDALGKLSLTDSGLHRREKLVIDTCLSSGVPIACLMGGGYDEDLDLLAKRHCIVHQAASELWSDHRL